MILDYWMISSTLRGQVLYPILWVFPSHCLGKHRALVHWIAQRHAVDSLAGARLFEWYYRLDYSFMSHLPTVPDNGLPVRRNCSSSGSRPMWSTSSMSSIWLQLKSKLTNEYIFLNPTKDLILFWDRFSDTKFPSSVCQSVQSVIRFSHRLNVLSCGKWLRYFMDFKRFWSAMSVWSLGASLMLWSNDVSRFPETFK